MLLHSGVEWDIIILDPTTERVKQEDGVLVSELEELYSSVAQKKGMSVVEWVSELESIDCIGISGLDLIVDLLGGKSVLVKSVVELDVLNVSYF